MRSPRQPIRDTTTGREYRSKYAAGKALAKLVNGDPSDTRVWYKVHRAFPHRFQRQDDAGTWVPHPYSDYFDPAWRVQREARETPAVAESAAEGGGPIRRTTIDIDQAKFEQAQAALGTATLRDTVDRAFDEVLRHVAIEESIERLTTMTGLDLDKPEVMARAWR